MIKSKLLNSIKLHSQSNLLYSNKFLFNISFKGFCTNSTLEQSKKIRKLAEIESEEQNITPEPIGIYDKNEKLKRLKTIKQEVSLNPEFETVFSHLLPKDDEGNVLYTPKGRIPNRNDSFFSSLLNKHKRGYDFKSDETKIQENYDRFIDAYSKAGPKYKLSKDEMNKIHEEIDLKMKELEDSGLSKEEILYNEPKGFPLKQDQFFQFLKKNRKAREMLIAPTEDFSVDTVIDKALKQNIGPDPSIAGGKVHYMNPELVPEDYDFQMQNKKFNRRYKNEKIEDDSYYYKSNYDEKMRLHLNYYKAKPITLIRKPLSRSEKRKKFMIKNISVNDIHWKNLPLMATFLNEIGRLKNRYQTRLPFHLHKKVVRTLKHMRAIGVFPARDRIRATDKIPFSSSHNQFLNEITKVVDPKSGALKLKPIDLTLKDSATYGRYDSAKTALEENKKE